eukprot:506878-Pyramimonas_sp.AAC.1
MRGRFVSSWDIFGAGFGLKPAPRRRRTRARVTCFGSNFASSSIAASSWPWPLRFSRIWLLERSGLPRAPPFPDAAEDSMGRANPPELASGWPP